MNTNLNHTSTGDSAQAESLAVIMAGGHGTRLWPLSTSQKPKQFQALLGNETMLQTTFKRLNYLPTQNIYVSTNSEYADLVKEQLPELPIENIIIEPSRRDTGPAMAFVTYYLAQKGFGNEVLSIVYADHYIKETEQFQEKLQAAQILTAKTQKISIVQVKAKEPNTNLGYVKLGKSIEDINGHKVYELDRFVEKPNYDAALSYANSLDYLWNTGLYSWHINSFLKLLELNAPEISQQLSSIKNFTNFQAEYEQMPKISIDYALMEKLSGSEVLIVPAEFTWSDVGNWQTIHEQLSSPETTNVINGNVHTFDTTNSIIYGQAPQKIVTIGLDSLAIISTPDTILICPKNETDRLKKVVDELNQKNN